MLMRTPKTRYRRLKDTAENRRKYKGADFYGKDPAIGAFAAAVKNELGISNINRATINEMSKSSKGEVHTSTIVGWLEKDTYRPQNYTMDRALASVGLERVIRRKRRRR